MQEAIDFNRGQRVRYIPGHAYGDPTHRDCEDGTVSSNNGINVFALFDKNVARLGWRGATSQSCNPAGLIKL